MLLVGCGYMGREYIKALKILDEEFIVIGKTIDKCKNLEKEFDIEVFPHGIDDFFRTCKKKYNRCIIATPIDVLENHLEIILENGIQHVLIEKPGGLDVNNMERICSKYPDRHIVVAYNRRFYENVKKAREIILQDGGVRSFSLDITEIIHNINISRYNPIVLEKWFLSMTTHVIDLAFYLCGEPTKMKSMVKDSLDWHPTSAIFCGVGETRNGALFSYHGDWTSAGRWKLEIFTKNNLLIFCPLEHLKIQKKGELIINDIVTESDGLNIKPGIFEQTKIFINDPFNEIFISYRDQCERIKNIYNKMAGY